MVFDDFLESFDIDIAAGGKSDGTRKDENGKYYFSTEHTPSFQLGPIMDCTEPLQLQLRFAITVVDDVIDFDAENINNGTHTIEIF